MSLWQSPEACVQAVRRACYAHFNVTPAHLQTLPEPVQVSCHACCNTWDGGPRGSLAAKLVSAQRQSQQPVLRESPWHEAGKLCQLTKAHMCTLEPTCKLCHVCMLASPIAPAACSWHSKCTIRCSKTLQHYAEDTMLREICMGFCWGLRRSGLLQKNVRHYTTEHACLDSHCIVDCATSFQGDFRSLTACSATKFYWEL